MYKPNKQDFNVQQLNELLSKLQSKKSDDKNPWKIILITISILAIIGGTIYAIYKWLTPNYLEDFDEDFDMDDEDFEYYDEEYTEDDFEDEEYTEDDFEDEDNLATDNNKI